MKATRRNLFRGALRYAACGVLAGGAGAMGLKRARLLREGKCVNRSVCKDCPVLADCGLPRALSVRRATGVANG